jgi:3-dehydroquinate synthetase
MQRAEREALGALITALGPLPPVADLPAPEAVEAIRRDKKVVNGRLHFVLGTGLGSATVVDDVSEEEIRAALVRVGLKG